jgi:hypothetical protein
VRGVRRGRRGASADVIDRANARDGVVLL